MRRPIAAMFLLLFALGACRSGDLDLGEGTPDAGPRTGPYDECGNGMDDDGDGSIDEGCPCGAGESQPCFSGDYPSRDVGACQDGSQQCVVEGSSEFGLWGSCSGDVLPGDERCDGSDADCDGAIDEGCPCTFGDTQPCGAEFLFEPCSAGTQRCEDTGEWSSCEGAVGPTAEVCGDGIDNDCDGTPDERCDCVPEPERCGDGIDNDCDGVVDEPDGCFPRMDAGVPVDGGTPRVDAGAPECSGSCTPSEWRNIGETIDASSSDGTGMLGTCVTPEGGALAVYRDGTDFRMRRLNASGAETASALLGLTLEVVAAPFRATYNIAAELICLGDRFIVGYRDADRALALAAFDYDGNIIGTPAVVDRTRTRTPMTLARAGGENYIMWVSWDDSRTLRLLSRRYDDSLAPLGGTIVLTPEHRVSNGKTLEARVRGTEVIVHVGLPLGVGRTDTELIIGVTGDTTTFLTELALAFPESGDTAGDNRHLAITDDGPMALCYPRKPTPCCPAGEQLVCQFLRANGEALGEVQTITPGGSEGFDFGMTTDGCRVYVSSYCRTIDATCRVGGYLYSGDPSAGTWERQDLPVRDRNDTILGRLPLSAELLRVGSDLWHFGITRSNGGPRMQLHDLRVTCIAE